MSDETIKKEEIKTAETVSLDEQTNNITSSISSSSNDEANSLSSKETELEKCRRERDEYLAGWQRAKADFLNYQKDERKRMEEFLKFCEAGLIGDLLPVLDSFDLALTQTNQIDDIKYKGFFLIKSQLDDILKKRGLESIKSVGEKFNPEFHEVLMTIEDKTKEADTIVEEIQKGYILNERVLRPAKVKIIK